MSELITGLFYDIGSREIYEDRVAVKQLTTPGGLQLTVAAVADGVGGENKGERAAQLAIETTFSYFAGSGQAQTVPELLQEAVAAANQAVLREAAATAGATTTLTIAAVHNDKMLYIANVGDSQIYLCRSGKLTQLTIDHSFANVMPWQSEMSQAAAAEHPRAEVLMRYLGRNTHIQVDLGFYVGTTDPQQAQVQGCQGLPLKKGDSILLCSDGLTKEYEPQRPFATPQEISRVLTTQEGDKAARSLVSFALGRNANDNVSVAIIQTPDPKRKRRGRRPFLRALAFAILLFLIIGSILFYYLQQTNEQQVQTLTTIFVNEQEKSQAAAQATQAAIAATATSNHQELAAQATAAQQTAAAQQNELFLAEQTRSAVVLFCLRPSSYDYKITEPIALDPPPVYVHITNRPIPVDFSASVTWNITNRGECPLTITSLADIDNNERLTPVLEQDGKAIPAVPSNQTAQLTVIFTPQTVNDLRLLRDRYEADEVNLSLIVTHEETGEEILLFDQPQLSIQQSAHSKWFRLEVPPPTSTPRPATSTPLPEGLMTPLVPDLTPSGTVSATNGG